MPGLYVPHLKDEVVRPALALMGPAYSTEAAVSLVTGTALVETNASYLKQIAGPALGLFQMEPTTLFDIWDRWLKLPEQAGLRSRLIETIPIVSDIETQVVFDMRFAAIMCRCKYRMSEAALPAVGDPLGMCKFWKAAYNTATGAGWVNGTRIGLFQQAIAA